MQIKDVTIAFANDLFEAKAGEDGGTPKFKSTFLIKPTDAQVVEINKAITECAVAKWGAKGEATLKQLRAANKVCFGDGDMKPYNGFAGNMYLGASNAKRPTAVNRDRTPVTAADGVIYSGCVVNAQVSFWAQDNKYGKRVNAELQGVQFVRDGVPFSAGAVASESDFDDISEGATADDLS